MNRRTLALVAMLGAILASGPVFGQTNMPRFDYPFGFLMIDASCPGATHSLIHPCPPHAPIVYLSFRKGADVTPLVGRNVAVKGRVNKQSTCPAPLVRVARIAQTSVVPPCPPEECQPGDPPPCPSM